MRKLESQVFKRPELSIQVLLFDNFKFCCLAKHVPNCQPTSDEFSVCEDLMGNFVLRVCIWVLGIVASFGNLLVIGWRINYKLKNKVRNQTNAFNPFFSSFFICCRFNLFFAIFFFRCIPSSSQTWLWAIF